MPSRQITLASALREYSECEKPICFDFINAIGDRQTVTASDLLREAVKWAAAFRDLGVVPGDRVILSIERNDLFVYAFWGCQLIAAVPTTLAPFENQARVEQQCDHVRNVAAITKPRIIVIESQFVTASDLAVGALTVDGNRIAAGGTGDIPEIKVDPSDIALIQFTSGSTRVPKGCALSHRAITDNAKAILERGGGRNGDVNVHWVPLSHDMGLMGAVIVPVIGQHRSVIMHPRRFMMRPLTWLEELAGHHEVHTSVPNFALRMVTRRADRFELPADSLSHVKNIICGAEAINPGDVRAFFQAFERFGLPRSSFHASYGMAEATVMATSSPGGLKTFRGSALKQGQHDFSTDQREYVSVGTPVAGAKIRIVDDNGVQVREGSAGEIELASASTMAGYFNDAESTAEKIVGGWLKTGDIGFVFSGNLFIAGRRSDLLIVAGRNIYPSDIEPAVADNLGIDPRKVAVFSAEGSHGTEELIVLVERHRIEKQNEAARNISRVCREVCGVVPNHVLFRKSGTIPKTTSGKIKRNDLQQIYSNGDL